MQSFVESDAELVRSLVQNDRVAWAEFHARYDRLVERCIGRVTRRFSSVLSPEDVREITSIFHLSILANDRAKLRLFDPSRGHRFSTWIGLLAMNCAYDYLRARKRDGARMPLSDADTMLCSDAGPFDMLVAQERVGLARSMLNQLSDRDRAFATLYFGEELDPSEIAKRMRISVKTVYTKKHKLQAKLESLVSTGAVAA